MQTLYEVDPFEGAKHLNGGGSGKGGGGGCPPFEGKENVCIFLSANQVLDTILNIKIGKQMRHGMKLEAFGVFLRWPD